VRISSVGTLRAAEAVVAAFNHETLAGVGQEAQGHELALVVHRDLHGASGLELIQRLRGWIGAQILHGVGIVDAGAREQAAERVAALHALFAPVGGACVIVLDCRQWQHPLDQAGGHRLQDGIGRCAESRDREQAHGRERGILPGMSGGALRRLR
jgi:hypothetical protein